MKPYELKVKFENDKEKIYKLYLGNKALYFLEDEFGLTMRELFSKLKDAMNNFRFSTKITCLYLSTYLHFLALFQKVCPLYQLVFLIKTFRNCQGRTLYPDL